MRSLVTFVTLMVFVPGISWLCSRYLKCKPLRRDINLARGGTLFFIFGSLCLAMINSQTLVVVGFCLSALGSAIPMLCRAVIMVLLRGHRSGFLLGLLAIAEVLGMLVCQLLLGWLFDVGLRAWAGLPFGVAFLLVLFIGVPAWAIRLSRMQQEGDKHERVIQRQRGSQMRDLHSKWW
ncbi:hypothetical protein B0I35DRAFT_129630 [Stachybotrys elegans]|uniref:Major facilitator superfamily (MFS) profile domain-containing protein n=1 Tax=Stachybotrys elegans TaxID=80388 RepID=A0A8K0SZE7_9HYPO|nr:hypothetical protein B0I35DRAFT_129630 [Stachybotrys elegans]